MPSNVWRMCITCDAILPKDNEFSKDKFKCNTCYRRNPAKGVLDKPNYPAATASRGKWKALFDYIDVNSMGFISRSGIEESMRDMLGEFKWADSDGSATMDFDEFLQCMLDLPATTRKSALQYAGQLVPGTKWKPSGLQRKNTAQMGAMSRKDEEKQAWQRMFNYLDEDGSGSVNTNEIMGKMTKMLGPINWTDNNADGQMDFGEFSTFMDRLPASTRYSALTWAKSHLDKMGRKSSFNVPRAPATDLNRVSSVINMTRSGSNSGIEVRKSSFRSGPSEEDRAAWKKFFNHLDEDRSGYLSFAEIQEKMELMLGSIKWVDTDGSGTMDFNEFVTCMMKLPINTRVTALAYARQRL